MSIELRDLKKIIKEAIRAELIKEADVTEVNPAWMGAYAFVLAYNDSISQGLFPRGQRLDIQFMPIVPVKQKEQVPANYERVGIFKNNTLFVDPRSKPIDDEFWESGPGHDMLHGLTQNLQQHFGAIKPGEYESPRNKIRQISPGQVENLLIKLEKDYKISFEKEFPDFMRTSDQIREKNPKLFLNDLIAIAKNKFLSSSISPKWSEIISKLSNLLLTKKYWTSVVGSDGESLEKDIKKGYGVNNPTHAYEEMIGNIVSDSLFPSISKGNPISFEQVNNIFKKFVNPKFTEFPAYETDANEEIIKRWIWHFKEILPIFAELYNKRLGMLKKTNFGVNHK